MLRSVDLFLLQSRGQEEAGKASCIFHGPVEHQRLLPLTPPSARASRCRCLSEQASEWESQVRSHGAPVETTNPSSCSSSAAKDDGHARSACTAATAVFTQKTSRLKPTICPTKTSRRRKNDDTTTSQVFRHHSTPVHFSNGSQIQWFDSFFFGRTQNLIMPRKYSRGEVR